MIVYLHGFRSSPSSFKAQLLRDYFAAQGRAQEFVCPQLPASPRLAMTLVKQLIDEAQPAKLAMIGSSLGGFYANHLAEYYACRTVVINPAVTPPRDLAQYVGVTKAYHSDEVFEFKSAYLDELRALVTPVISHPERYFLLAATGDEILDWREMVTHYVGAKQFIVQGGDHGLSDFSAYLPQVVAFCDAE